MPATAEKKEKKKGYGVHSLSLRALPVYASLACSLSSGVEAHEAYLRTFDGEMQTIFTLVRLCGRKSCRGVREGVTPEIDCWTIVENK